jgi:uncharacterized membrane protein YedE/YeeE
VRSGTSSGALRATPGATVIAFLDVAGRWNPALAFVLFTAILVAAPAFRRFARTSASASAGETPSRRPDRALIVGSAVFGIGWGLTGVCPGPALVRAAGFVPDALVFCAAMVGGMTLLRLIRVRSRPLAR